MAVSDGRNILVYRELGLVCQVFNEGTLVDAPGRPVHRAHALLDHRVDHLGERPAGVQDERLARPGPRAQREPGEHGRPGRGASASRGRSTTDTDIVVVDARPPPGRQRRPRGRGAPGPAAAARRVLVRHHRRTDAVTPVAIRTACVPLAIGRLPAGLRAWRPRRARWTWSAPRTSARSNPASWSRSTTAGSARCGSPRPTPALCLFEFVYLGRADSRMYGRSAARGPQGDRAAGCAREAPVDADMVMPVPDTAVSAAQGYAEASGIPYGDGTHEEPLHRPDVHRADADAAPARREAEAEPDAGRRRGPAADRGGRLDRARARPPASWSQTLREAGPRRSTCASPRRRSGGRASTGSTCRRARS